MPGEFGFCRSGDPRGMVSEVWDSPAGGSLGRARAVLPV